MIRIKGIHKIDPNARKILKLLRLKQINNAVFVKINAAIINMIRYVEPYITWGYPSRSTITKLVYKRGFAKLNSQRIPLSDNRIVEEGLGKKGLICVEDLIHEIVTVGPNFKEANNFLWPFKLNTPVHGWSYKKTSYMQNGDAGPRDVEINALAQKML